MLQTHAPTSVWHLWRVWAQLLTLWVLTPMWHWQFAPVFCAVEAIESALSRRNFCTFTGLFLTHILKPRLSQKHSSCSQNHSALCLSTAGLSCCKFCFKNDEKMAKSEIKWPGFWLCTKIVYQNMNLELYCQEFKRAISMCPKDRKKWAKTGRNGQK